MVCRSVKRCLQVTPMLRAIHAQTRARTAHGTYLDDTATFAVVAFLCDVPLKLCCSSPLQRCYRSLLQDDKNALLKACNMICQELTVNSRGHDKRQAGGGRGDAKPGPSGPLNAQVGAPPGSYQAQQSAVSRNGSLSFSFIRLWSTQHAFHVGLLLYQKYDKIPLPFLPTVSINGSFNLPLRPPLWCQA